MRSYSYSKVKHNSLKLEYKNGGELIRIVTIKVGLTYKIEPDNKAKTTNKGRICTVIDFIKDDLDNPIKVKVKFQDTGRNGRVDLEDLLEIE